MTATAQVVEGKPPKEYTLRYLVYLVRHIAGS